MSEKAPTGLLTHDEYRPQDNLNQQTEGVGRRQAGALNIVENPLKVRYLLLHDIYKRIIETE